MVANSKILKLFCFRCIMNEKRLVLGGLGASKGVYEGRARIIFDIRDIETLQEGDVLVTKYTTPEWTAAYLSISAVVTDEGGLSCHQAIVSRQFDIPCVVGTQYATQKITDGERIIVNGTKGEVVYRLD